MEYKVNIEGFEGPLDLLYDLILKKKMEIKDISIIEITENYIQYIGKIDSNNIDNAVDFLAMASKLLDIKARYLLYIDQLEEENPADKLVGQLEKYKIFKEASIYIKDRIRDNDNRFYRKRMELVYEDKIDLSAINLETILTLLPSLFSGQDNDYRDKKSFELSEIIKKKNISLDEKIIGVREKIKNNASISFRELVSGEDKDNIIASFLCILEMIKAREVEVVQEKIFESILIKKI